MNLIELSKYLRDDELAEKYLLQNGILKTWTHCPHCNSDKLGKISRSRIKCYKCKKEWHKRKGSILEARHISSNIFLAIIKLFSDSTGVTAIAFELNLDVKTVIDVYDDLSDAILKEYSLEASTFANSVFYLTQQKNAEIRVLEKADQINIGKETFGKFKILRNRNLDLSYSFSYEFDWVQSKDRSIKNNINRFLNYLKYNLSIYRGISQKHFRQYFGILLIRYNAQGKDMFSILLKSLKIKGG